MLYELLGPLLSWACVHLDPKQHPKHLEAWHELDHDKILRLTTEWYAQGTDPNSIAKALTTLTFKSHLTGGLETAAWIYHIDHIP